MLKLYSERKARRIIAGRIESGMIRVGDRIKIYSEGRETTVKEIACWLERDRQQSFDERSRLRNQSEQRRRSNDDD